MIINTQLLLQEACEKFNQASIICIDTEFERRSTYFAKLSIVQITTGKYSSIIDILNLDDLNLLGEVLQNPNILKIFHAPQQDFEIFAQIFKNVPQNVFDTQIAAKVCGIGNLLSYANLCNQLLNVSINKTYQTANWLARPIPQELIEYAITDVIYLKQIYEILNKIMQENNLSDIYNNEMRKLVNYNLYIPNLNNAWTKVKFHKNSIPVDRMKIIAAFREECAISLNLPRRHVATDLDLVKLCKNLPTNILQLKKLNLEKRIFIDQVSYSQKLIDMCSAMK